MWPGVPLAALAHVEHLHAVARASAARRPHRSIARDRPLLLPPARHAAVQEAGQRGSRPRPRAGRPAAVLVVAADEHDLLLAVGQPGEPGAEAGAQHRDRRPRPGCARRRTAGRCGRRRPSPRRRALARPGAARAAASSTPSVSSGPRLRSTIAWKFGGCGAERGQRRARRTRPRRRSPASGCARARSRSWRRSSCPSPGPPHIEPPRWPGQTSTCRAAPSSCSCSERKMPRAPSDFSIARSGRATSLTNSVSPVSTAHGSSPRRVSISANAVCSGRCPGVWSARTRSEPSSSSQPSSNGSWS